MNKENFTKNDLLKKIENFTMDDLLKKIENERKEDKDIEIVCNDLFVKIFSIRGDEITTIYKLPIQKLTRITLHRYERKINDKLLPCMEPDYSANSVTNKYDSMQDILSYSIVVDEGFVGFVMIFKSDTNAVYTLKIRPVLLFDYRKLHYDDIKSNVDIIYI